MTDKPPICIVDADTVIYRNAVVAEKKITWDEGEEPTSLTFPNQARSRMHAAIARIREAVGLDHHFIFATTGDSNFRYDVFPDYKSNRSDTVKPELLPMLREELQRRYFVINESSLEADDLLSIYATAPNFKGCLVGVDKDFLTIPHVRIYNWVKDEWATTTGESAFEFFLMQVVCGDTCDGYKGIPKAGAAAFKKCVTLAKESPVYGDNPKLALWLEVLALGEKKGVDQDYVLQMARVAHLLTFDEFDPKTKQIKLWEPPE